MKKAISLLFFTTLLLLAACGQNKAESVPLTQYHAVQIPVNADIATIDAVCFYDDVSYMLCRRGDNADRVLLTLDDGEITEMEFNGAEMTDIEMGVNGVLYSSAVSEADNISVMKSTPDGLGDKSVDLVIDNMPRGMSVFLQDLATDGSGQVYVAWSMGFPSSLGTATGGVTVLDSDLNHAFTLEHDKSLNCLATDGNGTVYADIQGEVLQAIDPEKKAWAAILRLTDCAGVFPRPGGDFYVDREGGLYVYDIENATYTEVLSWRELGIEPSSKKLMAFSGDDLYFTSNEKLYILKEGPGEPAAEDDRTVLTLVTDSMHILATTELVTRFNSENKDYRIDVRECGSLEEVNALILEMTTGKVPDMFVFSSKMHARPFLNPQLYGAKGFLMDLYPLIDSDPELSRRSFYPNILEAAESGGCLYEMPVSFMVEGVVARSQDVGYEPGWTLADIKEVLARFPDMKYPFGPTMLRNTMLRYLLAANYDSLVNWAEGTCHFESQTFLDILELAKMQPTSYDGTEKLEPDLIADGEQLVHPFYLPMANYLQQYPQIMGAEEVTYIGYPTGAGVGNFISYNSSFGISSQTEHGDAAWQFLRQLITKDCGSPVSVNIAATEKYLSSVEDYENTGTLGYGRSESNSYSVKLDYSTPEDIEMMRILITSLDRVARNDSSVYDIVCEEAQWYFEGGRTAAEVAAIIQCRVSIYVSENIAG